MRSLIVLAAAFALAATLPAQQPAPASMGTVPTHDALVTGGLEVRGDNASLVSNASVTAYDHTAAITLDRGGSVLVCATSQFHLLHSGTGDSLLFGLDRGAIEIHSPTQPQDVILTPDIRFTIEDPEHPRHFDLSLRVTPNGDTCVDNAGPTAPVLDLADSFSDASYRLIPGQHVLFEHGSLREVVDNEQSPCGCPPEPAPPPTQLASPTTPSQPVTPPIAAAQHPFPAAASEGLAPITPPANSIPAGEKHTQISTSLTYDANHPTPPPSIEPPPATTSSSAGTAAKTSATPPPTPPGAHDIFHAIGHFFHKLFHPKSSAHPSQPSS